MSVHPPLREAGERPERELARVRRGFAASPGIIDTAMAVVVGEELK